MKPGDKIRHIILIIFFSYSFTAFAENRITSSPLINLSEIKPSFEDVDDRKNVLSNNKKLKKKKTR